MADWHKRNRDHLIAYNRAYNKKRKRPEPSKERTAKATAATKRWREKNRSAVRATNKRWRERHPDRLRLAQSASKAAWRARQKAAEGQATSADLAKIRKAQKDRCAYCRGRLMGRGQLDHIKPLARGGTNWPRNLQWTCDGCNREKLAQDPIDFARKRGALL